MDIDDKIAERIAAKKDAEKAEGIYLQPSHFIGYNLNDFRFEQDGKIFFTMPFESLCEAIRNYVKSNKAEQEKQEL